MYGSGCGDWDSPLLRLGYTSLTTPSSVSRQGPVLS